MKRTLVILTLNEIDGVRQLIPQLPADVADEIIAVDGGSTDGTREFLEERQIRVFGQSRRGRGQAFRIAMEHAKGDQLVYFSPDGNEDPKDIVRLFEVLDSGADMAIASRFLKGSRNEEDNAAFPLRKWVNQAFTLMANVMWNKGPRVTDTINGYRGIRREAFLTLAPESMRYPIEYDLTIKAMKAGMRIVEIPTLEGERVGGETKAPSFRTGLDFFRLFLKEVVRRPGK